MALRDDKRFMDSFGNNIAMINGQFNLPPETIKAMGEIRQAVSDCGKRIAAATVQAGVQADAGAMIHATQLLQQVKNRACDALILPHGPGAAIFESTPQHQQ